MALFDNFRKNNKIASQIRNEQRRIENLDWAGLEKHLKEYHNYFLEKQLIPNILFLIKGKDPAAFNQLIETFKDNNFGLRLEKCTYGMLYLGWSIGVGLMDEQFPDEIQELNEGLKSIKRENEELLYSKGMNSEFIINCFSAMRQQMFEIGKEHGCKPEFIEFRPRRSVYIS
ncbi:hypothetical protein AB1L07_20950 [Niallia alba]|uniref:hypothetical protein n=1 Tax=Niallia alba TaxID=2729105 RepID=UPI0039A36D39